MRLVHGEGEGGGLVLERHKVFLVCFADPTSDVQSHKGGGGTDRRSPPPGLLPVEAQLVCILERPPPSPPPPPRRGRG